MFELSAKQKATRVHVCVCVRRGCSRVAEGVEAGEVPAK